jgi:FtsZ-binding cell division protein ZapB
VLKSVDVTLLQLALEVIRERKQYCLDRESHSKAKADLSTKEEENYKKLVKSWVEDDQKSREQIWNYK